MIFAILTLFSALTLAAVAGWFSIAGVMSIYIGAPMHAALVMGVTLEAAKLVTTSWLYRNWDHAGWRLKLPLIYFVTALMLATSIGVFGFLTKSHLEQGASTIDNTAKIERLDQQIAREQSNIADNEKVIGQLDATVNSFIGKDKADRAVVIRRSQAQQRKQLRADIDAAQLRVDTYSDEKFTLTSEVRALSLEVGPIRYIAELFYTTDVSETEKVETAVKLFTLLIVSTLDPLAVILLIAANHTILRLKNEKALATIPDTESTESTETVDTPFTDEAPVDQIDNSAVGISEQSSASYVDTEYNLSPLAAETHETEVEVDPSLDVQIPEQENNENDSGVTLPEEITAEPGEHNIADITHVAVDGDINVPESTDIADTGTSDTILSDEAEMNKGAILTSDLTEPELPSIIIKTPALTRVDFGIKDDSAVESSDDIELASAPWAHQSTVLRELLGDQPHFVPETIVKKDIIEDKITSIDRDLEEAAQYSNRDKYPKALSWLKEFKGD